MYQDTVREEKLLDKPWFVLSLFAALFVILFFVDLSTSGFAELLAPAIGNPEESGVYGQFATGITMAAIVTGVIWRVSRLPLKAQSRTVWVILAMLFMLFFTSFNLSFSFIQSKLWFMVSQGIVTTLYVSVISISIASVLAIIGAVAKLSSNGIANGIASFYTSFFRGLPLLMQVYLIYLGLLQLGFVIDAIPAGVAALSRLYD